MSLSRVGEGRGGGASVGPQPLPENLKCSVYEHYYYPLVTKEMQIII